MLPHFHGPQHSFLWERSGLPARRRLKDELPVARNRSGRLLRRVGLGEVPRNRTPIGSEVQLEAFHDPTPGGEPGGRRLSGHLGRNGIGRRDVEPGSAKWPGRNTEAGECEKCHDASKTPGPGMYASVIHCVSSLLFQWPLDTTQISRISVQCRCCSRAPKPHPRHPSRRARHRHLVDTDRSGTPMPQHPEFHAL